jgi:uncharacterized LabA/DUF88 family protein
MSNRSIVYVDGFNLYYGAVRGTDHRWLDLQLLFRRLRQHDDLQAIRYFTAEVDGERGRRQNLYLQALATCPLVEVILGRYKYKRVKCGVDRCRYRGSRFFRVPEEKRTDVAIGVRLLDDAYQDCADRFVLVSGDSDLVPSIHPLKARFPEKQVIVYVPARNRERGAATELRTAADRDRTLPMALIERCQFPTRVPDGQGGWIDKPARW